MNILYSHVSKNHYIHPLSINGIANPVLFADDTSIIITNPNPEEFKRNISLALKEATNWFHCNLLTLLILSESINMQLFIFLAPLPLHVSAPCSHLQADFSLNSPSLRKQLPLKCQFYFLITVNTRNQEIKLALQRQQLP
jgi:hypothetical protein